MYANRRVIVNRLDQTWVGGEVGTREAYMTGRLACSECARAAWVGICSNIWLTYFHRCRQSKTDGLRMLGKLLKPCVSPMLNWMRGNPHVSKRRQVGQT